jgi:hypothetical protein
MWFESLALLWIRNDLVRILFSGRSGSISGPGILSFKQGRLSNWQILSVHNWAAATPSKYFKDLLRKHVCNQRRLVPFWRKICKNYNYRFSCQKGQIRYNYSGSDRAKRFLIRTYNTVTINAFCFPYLEKGEFQFFILSVRSQLSDPHTDWREKCRLNRTHKF